MFAFGQPIAGETLVDPTGLKDRAITNREQLNEAEARNIYRAHEKYLLGKLTRRTAPFNFGWCLKLHREMFGDVWQWAGTVRQRNLNFGCSHEMIAERLAHMLDDLPTWTDFGINLVEQSARLHHRAVSIHPFENGNGRWSRLLANIWLRLHGHAIIVWPESTVGRESQIREAYLAAIRAADDGNLGALTALHDRYLERR